MSALCSTAWRMSNAQILPNRSKLSRTGGGVETDGPGPDARLDHHPARALERDEAIADPDPADTEDLGEILL